MILIETFSKKFSAIFTENATLLHERKLHPQAVIKYALNNKDLVLIAVEDKEAIGFIIGFSGQNKNSILTIFVSEECRNKKIGSLLVSTLMDKNRASKDCLWTVRLRSIDNGLIGFFEKCGFQKITELNLYKKHRVEFKVSENHLHLSDTFNIQVADLSHANQLMKIEKNCFDDFWLRTKEEWKTILEDQNNIVFIIEDENIVGQDKIIGFSHNSINKTNGNKEGQYIRIAVNPSYRRAGIATKLTEKAFDYFQRNKVNRVYLSTVKDNDQLNTMYKRWGFEVFDSDVILTRK